MNVSRRSKLPTPRLLVVGLVAFGFACHRQKPASSPAPAPAHPSAPVTKPKPEPAAPPAAAAVTSAASLVRATHDKYASSWYRTLTFVQKTTVSLSSGGQVVQTWYEAAQLPGRLRIDTDPASKGGVLYSGDSTYNFAGGKLVRADTGINELLVLGFDIYAQSPARTESMLRRLGFDLTRFHEGVWRGTPVFVVGALRGDTTSKQFWVDRERLLFVRLLENTRQGHADFRFNDYVQSGGGWVASEVEQYVNGKRRLLEQYSQIRTNVDLPDGLFDPRKWATAARSTP
jgi:hypothetical protein